MELIVKYLFLAALVGGVGYLTYWFVKRTLKKQADEQSAMVQQYKQTVPNVFILEKKMQKITNAKIPKSVLEEVPKYYRWRKMPLVRAKIGNQVVTLICDKKLFDRLPEKKNIKADIAGIYLVSFRLK